MQQHSTPTALLLHQLAIEPNVFATRTPATKRNLCDTMGYTTSQIDQLLMHPKLSLDDRRYNLRRDYETWFSDKNKVPDGEAWLLENLIQRQKDYFKSLATIEDVRKEFPTTRNLYQKKDMLEFWNLKLIEKFDNVANTWLLALDSYISDLSIENSIPSGA